MDAQARSCVYRVYAWTRMRACVHKNTDTGSFLLALSLFLSLSLSLCLSLRPPACLAENLSAQSSCLCTR